MRVMARRRSPASMTRDRATKTPPCGGAAARSRSAKRDLSIPCRPHRTGVNGAFCRLALGSDLLGDAAEHAVDKPTRLLGRVALGQLYGLRDHRGDRDVRTLEELVDADAQEVAVDHGHALDAPVLGEAADELVDVALVLTDTRDEVGCERVGVDRKIGE